MDESLHELRRQSDQKTTEIESLLATEQDIGSIENMDPGLRALLMSFTEPMSRNRSGPSEVSHTGISCARSDATFERWIREATLLLGPPLKLRNETMET